MKTLVKHSIYLLLFWFLLFFVNRLSYYLGVSFLIGHVSFALIVQSFFHALHLDLSMAAYLCVLPFFLFGLYAAFPNKWLAKTINGINYLFIVLVNLTAVGEMCLYREWKAKLSMQALEHFLHPSEVFKSASPGLTVVFFGLSLFLSWLSIWFYRKKIQLPHEQVKNLRPGGRFYWKSAVYVLVAIPFCGISIRGGFQEIPIQSSDAFFCIEPVVNDAAVNPLWNLAYSAIDYENHFKENPYKDFPQAEADSITRSLFKESNDSTVHFLSNPRPNIVFILLESWSAYEVKSFGGDDFAPFTDSLSRQGIRFTKCYPAGYVSDQGIPAVLSGYPAASRISIINQSSKSAPLPCINQDLKPLGYQSGFLFGGDLNYGNIRSYVYNKKFDVVKEEKDFESSIPRGKLGIQDGDMAPEFVAALNAAKAPFVYSWFTLSSHMPYDFPGTKIKLSDLENEYSNSISYADKALAQFFSMAKQQSWYNNTLFVLVADHSHGNHKDFSVYDPEYHRIPLFFFGNVIRPEFRGNTVEKVVSQLDIVKTVLRQMDLEKEASQYVWSKDLFKPGSRDFAFYCHYSGAGMVADDGFVGYQHEVKKLIINSFGDGNPKADSLARISRAFQQAVYEDYRLK